MATYEDDLAISEVCRMCLSDLSFEYYTIEGELMSLVSKLVFQINPCDERLPLNMCTNCFNILIQFNATKNCWIENQAKFDQEIVKPEIEDIECVEEIDQNLASNLELIDESQMDCNYSVEYVNELEHFDDTEFSPDADDLPNNEMTEEETSTVQIKRKRNNNKSKTKKSPQDSQDRKEKGKDTYQKLLKKCEECSKLIEKNRMEGHQNKHKNYRPYICDICEKAFYCKLLLRLHRTSIHTGQEKTCDVCDKTFPSTRSLYSHKLRHKNSDRYNCLYCERKFNNANSLKRHNLIHLGIREYTCDLCPSSFYRKFNLDVHIKTVHNKDKSYCCKYPNCTKKFGYSRLLREHIRRNHTEEIEVQGEEYMTPNVIES